MNKTNRKWISQIVACSFLAMLPVGAYAQSNKTIHGVVKDANGETIIGASVGQKGTKNATVTNLDGEFSISVPDNAVLEISYIGYNNQRVAVLTEDVHKLNELVVVGYGVMKKKDLTGAVGSLAAKDMENSPVANIGQAIQGKIAGLQVVDAGKPGDNVTIKVRGMGSINNCDPLVVIDGVPTDLGINALNMADVERLDVLKDASATAIYGSRGANGVIMITTKKGKEGKGSLSLSANLAIQCQPVRCAEQRHDEQFGQRRQPCMGRPVGARQRHGLGGRAAPYRIYAKLHAQLFRRQRQGTLLCIRRHARPDGHRKKRKVQTLHLPAER